MFRLAHRSVRDCSTFTRAQPEVSAESPTATAGSRNAQMNERNEKGEKDEKDEKGENGEKNENGEKDKNDLGLMT